MTSCLYFPGEPPIAEDPEFIAFQKERREAVWPDLIARSSAAIFRLVIAPDERGCLRHLIRLEQTSHPDRVFLEGTERAIMWPIEIGREHNSHLPLGVGVSLAMLVRKACAAGALPAEFAEIYADPTLFLIRRKIATPRQGQQQS